MKRRSLFLLLTAAALLLAAAAWSAAALSRGLRSAGERAAVTRGTLEDMLPLSGVVLRRETVLDTERSGLRVLAGEGRRLPGGAPLALAYDSGAELFRAALLLRLWEERQLSDSAPAHPLAEYAAALARRELYTLPLTARGLGQSLGLAGPGDPEALDVEIAALEPLGRENLLLSPGPGCFSPVLDGWEDLDPGELSPSALRARLEAPDRPARGMGKWIQGSEWSFCALVRGPEAARFSPGQRLTLRLPEGTDCAVRVGRAVTEGQDTLVVLRCREHLTEALSLRRVTLSAVFARYEGLLVPAAALWEEDGAYYVRRADLPLGGRTAVEPLYIRDGLALIRSDGLREGMRLIVQSQSAGPAAK